MRTTNRIRFRSALAAVLGAAAVAWALPAPAAMEIVSQEDKVSVDTKGVATVQTTVKVAKAEAGTLLIPTGFKAIEAPKVEGLPDATVAYSDKGGIRALAVTAPKAPTEADTIKISFTVPTFYDWKKEKVSDFGNRSMELKFMNTLPLKVAAYSLELMLPEGYVVNTVDDSNPKLTSKSPTPPFKIVRKDGKYGIAIKNAKLGIGDTCSVKIRFKEGSKSPVFLLACLGLCGLYLVGYRDLVASNGKDGK